MKKILGIEIGLGERPIVVTAQNLNTSSLKRRDTRIVVDTARQPKPVLPDGVTAVEVVADGSAAVTLAEQSTANLGSPNPRRQRVDAIGGQTVKVYPGEVLRVTNWTYGAHGEGTNDIRVKRPVVRRAL